MALYEFTDTIEAGTNPGLPAEAVSLNGIYIENVIPSFRTLSVRGREQADIDVYEIDNDYHDGGMYQRKRYRSRTITVRYQLISANNTAFRNAYNRLHAILDEEQMQVIFNDESDKYYTGTVSDIREVDEGTNAVVGEYDIFCADPYKYSVQEYEVEADENGLIELNYDGSFRAFPKLKAEIQSTNGFVGFVDGNGRIIQIGNPDEADGEDYEQSETLIDDTFTGALPSGWVSNAATVTDSTITGNRQQGSTANNSTYGRYASSYGTAPSSGQLYHGPTLTKVVPADSEQVSGAANFTCTWYHQLMKTSEKKRAEFNVLLTGTVNGTKQNIASMHFVLNTLSSYNMKAECFLMGTRRKLWEVTAKSGSVYTGMTGLPCSIVKSGNVFTFSFFGKKYSQILEDSEDYAVTEVSVWFKRYSTNTVADRCHLKSLKFVKDHVEKYRDIPNPFAAGDVVEANCESGAILLNGIEEYGLGALGNDWETFALEPGTNAIQCAYSEWADSSPDFSLTYRKAYL